MIPLRDNVPNVHPPVIVWALIGLNALVFLAELAQPEAALMDWFYLFGVVPARYMHPDWAAGVGYPVDYLYPFFTYMFLHSGWLHVILNMWMLWIFGDNVEDVMGHGGFLFFYVLCGLAALGTHMALNPHETIPVVGASGAIAGVLGAYILLYPHGKVTTFIPIFIIPWFVQLPAAIFLGLWFAIQVLSGLASHLSEQSLEVAWWAHVGGFVAGMALMPLFRRKHRCYYCYNRQANDYQRREQGDDWL